MRKRSTFGDELLATREDVGERLKKGLEVFNGGIRRYHDRNRFAAELDKDGNGGLAMAVAGGASTLHFASSPFSSVTLSCFADETEIFFLAKLKKGVIFASRTVQRHPFF